MQSSWSQFVAKGTPNRRHQSTWPLYSVEGDQHMVLRTPLAVSSGLGKTECDFWDAIQAAH